MCKFRKGGKISLFPQSRTVEAPDEPCYSVYNMQRVKSAFPYSDLQNEGKRSPALTLLNSDYNSFVG